MNIAYIVPSLINKGPVIVVRELVEQMIRHGHACTVYYFDQKPSPISFDCPTRQIGLEETIDFTRFDIVHSHGLRPDKYVAKKREYSGNTRYITTIHNYVFEDFKYEYNWLVAQIFGRLWLRSLRTFDRIVTLSEDAREYYRRLLPPERLTHAYNTRNPEPGRLLSPEEITELRHFKGDSTLIGVNALLTRRKGVDLLIKALVRLPEHKLFVVGDGPALVKLRLQADKLHITDRCYFAGYKTDAYRYLPYYDIYALPSRSEGFPLSLLEAACYSKACVASDLPIIKECFTEEEIAIFELRNPATIVEAIKKASAPPPIGEHLHNKYLSIYSPEKMYERYWAIYHGEV